MLQEWTVEEYNRRADWFRARPRALAVLMALYRVLPVCYIATFPLLPWLLWQRDADTWHPWARPLGALAACLLVLISGSLLRHFLNFPRPYQQPGFRALAQKQKQGHSFPSRHAFAASVIGVAWWYYHPLCGALSLLLALALCVTRVLAGVHYLRDVLAGFTYGALVGWFILFVLL